LTILLHLISVIPVKKSSNFREIRRIKQRLTESKSQSYGVSMSVYLLWTSSIIIDKLMILL